MIPAGASELRSAFWGHTRRHERSFYMLLFYAVECGLKSIYLRRNRLSDTGRITAPDLKGSHDIARWVKELKLPASAVAKGPSFRLAKDHTNHQIALAHQAWRYGVGILSEDEDALIEYLQKVHRWIEEALQR